MADALPYTCFSGFSNCGYAPSNSVAVDASSYRETVTIEPGETFSINFGELGSFAEEIENKKWRISVRPTGDTRNKTDLINPQYGPNDITTEIVAQQRFVQPGDEFIAAESSIAITDALLKHGYSSISTSVEGDKCHVTLINNSTETATYKIRVRER